jgi:hypothetical protein
MKFTGFEGWGKKKTYKGCSIKQQFRLSAKGN